MDPITAFSLACNIIQVVDFSIKVASTCRDLYKNGAVAENQEMELMSEHLAGLRLSLLSSSVVQSSGASQKLYDDEKKLEEIATNCSRTAAELVARLQSLKVEGPHKRRQAFTKTIKGFRESRKIESIQAKLKQYQEVLNTRILISLRQRHDLVTVQQQKNFRGLDRNVQKIIMSLADGKKNFNDLSALIHAENTSTKGLVSQRFEDQTKTILDRERCKSFLESLYFPEILSRQEEIADAHKQTFEWIFDASGSKVLPWNNFVEWLQRGEGIYWINGKAGSGKSTLMSYIAQQQRTTDYLKAWSEMKTNMRELCVPNFFFWSAGSQMQKSTLGLLRSLVYQIVKKYPDLLSLLTESEPSTSSSGIQCYSDQHPAWTERRLIATLQRVMRDKQSTCCFCFFIDGLDEFSGDQNMLIDLIRGLANNPDIKLCVSSRPLRFFQKAFEICPKLQLQDLTESDIRTYISDKLPESLKLSTGVPSITDRIIEKARGVFLWVNLAVKDQVAGIDNDDSLDQLEERLERLPSEIEDLYAYMLDRIDKVHRKEAAVYFQIALRNSKENLGFVRDLSLFQVALMTYPKIDDLLQPSSDLRISDIIRHCRWTRERLNTTCVGLLEIHSPDMIDMHVSADAEEKSSELSSIRPIIEQSPLEEAEIRTYYDKDKFTNHDVFQVIWLHRTTMDFFSESNQGKGFLEQNTPAEFQFYSSQVKAILAILFVAVPIQYCTRDSDAHSASKLRITRLMKIADADECMTGKSNAELLNLIDTTLAFVDQHYLLQPPQSHWCTRWNYLSPVSPLYSLDSVPEESLSLTAMSYVPCDFLGLATLFDVSMYVQEELARIGEHLEPNRATYLLACALKYTFYRSSKRFALVSQLLEKGADPNTMTFGITLWHQFLQSMFYAKLQTNFSDRDKVWEAPLKDWAELTVRFLQKNADIRAKIYVSEYVASLKKDSGPPAIIEYQMSPLSIIQLCLKDVSGFANLQDLCVVKGGCSYLKCTSFGSSAYDCSAASTYELSEQQSDEFLKVFKLSLNGEKTSRIVKKALSTKVAEIYEEMGGRGRDEDNIDSSTS